MSFIYGFLQDAGTTMAAVLTVAAFSQDFSTPRNECETTGPGRSKTKGGAGPQLRTQNGKGRFYAILQRAAAGMRESAYFLRMMTSQCSFLPFADAKKKNGADFPRRLSLPL